jgi:cytochrome P450
MVIVADDASAEHLTTKQSSSLERSSIIAKIFRSIIPTAQIVLPTNDMWKHHRRIIGTAMTSKYLSLSTPRANESIKHLIDLWKAKRATAGGRAWRAEEDLGSSTMDAICGMAFGANWGILESFRQQVKQSKPSTGPLGEAVFSAIPPPMLASTLYLFNTLPYKSPFPAITAFFTSLSPTWRYHRKQLSTYLDVQLTASRTRAQGMGADIAIENADNTLDLMVARLLKGDEWMPDSEVKDELYQYLVGGTETSATALSWWVKYMTNHPEVQIKLRKHVQQRLPDIQDTPPTFEDVNATNLPYLEAVVWETLRLGRIAAAFGRDGEYTVLLFYSLSLNDL